MTSLLRTGATHSEPVVFFLFFFLALCTHVPLYLTGVATGPPPFSGQQARRWTSSPAGLREEASLPKSNTPTDLRARPETLPAQRKISVLEKDPWVSQPIQDVRVNRVDHDTANRRLRTSDSYLRTATWENKKRAASLPVRCVPDFHVHALCFRSFSGHDLRIIYF